MRSLSLLMVTWLFSISSLARSEYKTQLEKLRKELLGLNTKIKEQASTETSLQARHHQAVKELRILEEGFRKKEEKLQSLQKELNHYRKAQRIDRQEMSFAQQIEILSGAIADVREDLKENEEAILRQRQLAVTIVAEIQSVRVELSSLAARAKATDQQSEQVGRKLKAD